MAVTESQKDKSNLELFFCKSGNISNRQLSNTFIFLATFGQVGGFEREQVKLKLMWPERINSPSRVNWSGNACESQQHRRSTGSTRPKLSAGRRATRWFTLIKSAICWHSLHIPGCRSLCTADATNYQLFWKWNLSGLEHDRERVNQPIATFGARPDRFCSLADITVLCPNAFQREPVTCGRLSCYFCLWSLCYNIVPNENIIK